MQIILEKLIDHPTLKIIAGLITAAFSILFGDVYTPSIIAIMMLFVFDTITGVWAAYEMGNPITSRRFGLDGFVKKAIAYFILLSASYFTDLTIPYDFVQLLMIAFVGVTEMISIIENIKKLGFKTPKGLTERLKKLRKTNPE